MFSQVRSLAADRVAFTSKLTTKQPPGPQLQAQPEKVASTSLGTIGARSSFSGARLAHEFPRSLLVAAIIFPHTKCLKKITDYRDTPALKTKGEREKKGVRAEKRDRDAEREKETFRRQRHHQ